MYVSKDQSNRKKEILMPKVSVIMPVFNGEKFLRTAIESILNQTYTDFELIIIDDGSTDNTPDIIESYKDQRIIFFRKSNQGVASSLNTGIRLSKAEYIARMDADDVSEPDRLKYQVDYLDQHPECVLVDVSAILIDEDGMPLRQRPQPHGENAIIRSLQRGTSPFNDPSVMFRKSAALSCGLFNEHMIIGSDWYLWAKLSECGKTTNIPMYLLRYRLNSSALTNLTPSMNRQMRALFREILKSGKVEPKAFSRLLEYKQNAKPKVLRALYYLRAGKCLLEGEWRVEEAKRYFRKSLQLSPWNLTSWLNYFFCFLPRNLVLGWKRFRMSVDRIF